MIAVLGAGALVAIVPTSTPLVADLALGAVGASALAAATWAWSVLRYVRALPLELGPVVARSRVDGTTRYLVRARLGLGRYLSSPAATARWVDDSGDEVQLRVVIPADRLVGVFSLMIDDPDERMRGDGTLKIELHGQSAGRQWRARHEYRVDDLQDGRFGSLDEWSSVQPSS